MGHAAGFESARVIGMEGSGLIRRYLRWAPFPLISAAHRVARGLGYTTAYPRALVGLSGPVLRRS